MRKDETETTLLVETSAGKVCCREKGSGERSLLLLHGSSFSKRVFELLMSDPALAGIRLVAIDLPGHGHSEDASDPRLTYSVSGFAGVVREILAARGLGGCVLLGWSLGGDIAIELLDGEPMVRGVALVSAPPVPWGILGRLRGYTLTGAFLAAKAKFTRAEALRFEAQCIGSSSDGRFIGDILRTDERMRPQLARSFIKVSGRDQRKVLRRAGLPVWLIAGDRDPLVRVAYLRKLRRDTAVGPEPFIAPDAGHAPFLDSPHEFAVRLAEFVRAADDKTPSRRTGGDVASKVDAKPAPQAARSVLE